MILELVLLAQAVATNVSKTFQEQIQANVVISVPSNCTVARVAAFTYTVSCTTTPPPPPPLTGNTQVTLPPGIQGVSYNASLALAIGATGGVPPYTYTVTGLPAGLTMTPAGFISGTPTVSGTFTISYTVTDSGKATTSAENNKATIELSGNITLPAGTISTSR